MTTYVLLLTTLVFILESLRRRDPILFGIGVSVALFYTTRSVILLSGWEAPEPAYLFGGEADGLFAQLDLIICLWLACMLIVPAPQLSSFWGPRVGDHEARKPAQWEPRPLPVTLITLASSLWLIAANGGFTATQRLVRLGNEGEGGTGIFLAAPSVLLVVAVWKIRADISKVGRPTASGLLAIGVSFATFFLLGSRTPIIAGLVALAIGGLFRMRIRSRYSTRFLGILLIAAFAVPQLAIGLRELRDDALTP